jgi:type II secretory pathway component PulC
MAKVLREGHGTSTNLIAAYAWLKLDAETGGGSIVGRVHMNEMALTMDTASLGRAQALAARFKAGQRGVPVARAIPDGDLRLKLGGITFADKRSLAVINGKTLSECESASLPLKSGTLVIKCQKIEKDSILIRVDGEDAPQLLRLR